MSRCRPPSAWAGPHSQAQYEELFRQADAGLYHAKQQGKARYSCCRDEGFLGGRAR